MTEERERPATEGAAPSRPPRTGFIHLKDPDEMRVVLVWEVEVHRGWSQAFGNWPAKPLSFRARDRHDKLRQTYRGMRAAYFHPEVAERLLGSGRDGDDAPLGADNRRSLELHKLVDHRDKDNKRVLRIGALEALRVSNGDGAGTAILVVHAVVPRTYVERLPGEPADDEQTDGEHSEGRTRMRTRKSHPMSGPTSAFTTPSATRAGWSAFARRSTNCWRVPTCAVRHG